ncbi:MAG: 23S rRNA (pseudouridine(1915)-N(3))-methyltransferase RlmH [Candidatus Aminicenantes bacterium]|nr:23S rRNA (pseudouridine(1915)-N(3))-methyltransferase RlmH [Candidatus Aminicenantes bacterium]
MQIKLLWPGRAKLPGIPELQAHYLKRITDLMPTRLIETSAAKGLDEKAAKKILEIEAAGLEKQIKDDYIVTLFDRGREMSSPELARFFEGRAVAGTRSVAFLVGGFLGLAPRLLERADLCLSLSRMTYSHELCRLVLMEQIFRALSLMKGRPYAK